MLQKIFAPYKSEFNSADSSIYYKDKAERDQDQA